MTDLVLHEQGIHLPKASNSKSIFRKYGDMVSMGGVSTALRGAESYVGVDHVSAFFDSIQQTSVGAITGSGLALTSHFLGGMEPSGIPLDAGGAGLFSAIGVLGARTRFGGIARSMGAGCATVFGLRKMEEWLGHRKASVHGDGDFGVDPIEEAAKGL